MQKHLPKKILLLLVQVEDFVDCTLEVKNATPLDKTPAYNSSLYSKSMFEKTIVSKITAGMKAKKDPIKHCKQATMTG